MTGAGISTESGIRDFRGPNGIWTKHPDMERRAYEMYQIFLDNPRDYWVSRLTNPYMPEDMYKAVPNAGHCALADLENIGLIRAVITQNIDGLHVKAGSKKVLEYHGSIDNPERNFKYPVDVKSDKIAINGKVVKPRVKRRVTIILNKPSGILSTTSDEKGRQTVVDIIPKKFRDLHVYPAGRLDKDSTGMILLTNDGSLTYRITHPKFEQEKEYLIQTLNDLTSEERHSLERGIQLEDGKTSPARIKPVNTANFKYSIAIHEGKKRQVRRMFESIGHPVLALKRIRIGKLELGDLKEGKTRELTGEDVALLTDGREIAS